MRKGLRSWGMEVGETEQREEGRREEGGSKREEKGERAGRGRN